MLKPLQSKKGHPYPIGVTGEEDGLNVSMIASGKQCGIILYDKNKQEIDRVELTHAARLGSLCYAKILVQKKETLLYQFYVDDEIVYDYQMKAYIGHERFGSLIMPRDLYGKISWEEYDWEEDVCPRISYEDCILYGMHVRGFTKHASSGVKGRGTFGGIIEKIPYLQELGVTTLELQPVYELQEKQIPFHSKMNPQKAMGQNGISVLDIPGVQTLEDQQEQNAINYWGYTEGLYYAPRNAYACSGNGDEEFRSLVKALHRHRMEVVLQFYFPKSVNRGEILQILKYWKTEYHVDGFHIKGENLPLLMLAQEPGLSDTKLFYYDLPLDELYSSDETPSFRNLAYYRDDYMYGMRNFLKGDENMVPQVLSLMRRQPEKAGQINYFSNYYGFTLADMVSYERKHNEENGEGNQDGNDYNCTWNCGVEGRSRKKAVVTLRNRQLRNALCMLFFSQGTPLLFMGDEFGNSQNGNNNPYCQDNEITWLNWKNLKQNEELWNYVKNLIVLRKAHPILHCPKELRLMDYLSCSFPDLSYHATRAWQPDMSSYIHHIGLLYCGKYARTAFGEEDAFFYVAMNMHWEPHEFALPKLPDGLGWYLLTDTREWQMDDGIEIPLANQQKHTVEPRSIGIFISKKMKKRKR